MSNKYSFLSSFVLFYFGKDWQKPITLATIMFKKSKNTKRGLCFFNLAFTGHGNFQPKTHDIQPADRVT